MAPKQKDLLTRLADAGEEAFQRLSDAPGMERATALAKSTRKQLDELTKRMSGIDALEKRVAKLERQLAGEKASKPSRRKPSPPSG